MTERNAQSAHQQGRRQRKRSRTAKQIDLWREGEPLPAPEPIGPVSDPTALVRSLGDPPLHAQSVTGGHYVAAVVEASARLAVALAATAGLLATTDGDDDET